MTIGKRIRQLRRSLDLTQKGFAERMGVKQSTIATYEIDRSIPIDAVISLICREFGVSEVWLRTGEGEMFAPAPKDDLYALLDSCGLPHLFHGLFQRYARLPEDARRELERMIEEWAVELAAAPPSEPDRRDWRDKDPSEWDDEDEATAVEEFRRQWRDEKNRRTEDGPVGGACAG